VIINNQEFELQKDGEGLEICKGCYFWGNPTVKCPHDMLCIDERIIYVLKGETDV
jgi:hypothetical protein